MYFLSPDFTQMKLVRPVLSAFAAQIVLRRLCDEADEAIKPQNGLHATRIEYLHDPDHPEKQQQLKTTVKWTDIGASTIPHVADIIQLHQPFTWACFSALAQRNQNKPKSAMRITRRPLRPVSVNLLIAPEIYSIKTTGGSACHRRPQFLALQSRQPPPPCTRIALLLPISPI